MEEFFGRNGILERRLEDYEFRPSQLRMANAVAEALEGGSHLVIEAGTGTGKTLAYLLPALTHGQRILVSTGTKTLQDQIFHKDIPLIERILDRSIRAAYLKGRNNYLCRLKLESLNAEGSFSFQEQRPFQTILDWAAHTETGDRGELGSAADDSALWSRLDARRDRCLGSKCRDFDQCFLTQMRRKALEADVVVVNHHLFFADLAIRQSDAAAILPDYTAVIFDEAHELEDVATEYFGFHVSNLRILDLVGDTKRLSDRSENPVEDLDIVQRSADRFFGRFLGLGEGRHPLGELEGIEAPVAALRGLALQLAKQKDFAGEWQTLERRANDLAGELEVFRSGALTENYVSWIERRSRGVFLEACPIDVSGMLRETLFDRVGSCILTSATLTVAGSFDYFRQRVGMTHGAELALGTEFDLQSQTMLYVPETMPDYRHPTYLQRATDEIRAILAASNGRAFVLFTSYQQMAAAYNAISEDSPYPCLIQERNGGTGRLLDEFRATPNAVLFATSSFWQGVDVKGEGLSAVIIDKLPFQVPSDPLVSARMSERERDGGSAFRDYQVPHAVLRLKQGLGRLIRSRSDRGLLAILDNRLRTKPYGKLFLDSLPDYRKTGKIEDLVEFMAQSETGARGRFE